jgi:sirohydrochlorin cobaltochelatase
MDRLIVLAVHGAPPNDFPPRDLAEYFALHARQEVNPADISPGLQGRAAVLEARLRDWPRTPSNDPFWAASQDLAAHLARETGCRVLLAFNEFCAPTLDAVLEDAAAARPAEVVVVTPMLTRGGEHAEREIAGAVSRAAGRHPDVRITYAWPYEPVDVARFLAGQIAACAGRTTRAGRVREASPRTAE